MLYQEHEHNPDPRNGWIFLAISFTLGILGLLWLNEQVKPRELFAPRYEQPSQMQEEGEDIVS